MGSRKDEFHYIVIPLRTFRHRKERLNKGLEEVLSPDESDKALRAARVLALGRTCFRESQQGTLLDEKTQETISGRIADADASNRSRRKVG